MESMSAVVLDMKMASSPSSSSSTSSSSLTSRKSLTMKQMLMLNAVVCGVEICACAGFTYIPPMLLKAGFAEDRMGFILGAGPLLGFFLVPVIGRASDHCYSQYGRRRPFILGLAIFLVVSLYLIPFGEYFASLIVGVSATSKMLGVWGLAAGVVLLDFTTQACLTPCEALLNDAAKNTEQNEKIFTVYSLMISLGGVVGYLLTAIDWTTNPMGEYFGGQEASIFSFLIVIFTMMLAATLIVAQETPLVKPIISSSSSSTSMDNDGSVSSRLFDKNASSSSSGFKSSDDTKVSQRKQKSLQRTPSSRCESVFWRCLHVLPYEGRFLTNACGWLFWLGQQLFPTQLKQLFLIPSVLKTLAFADFCCWTAIMGFNIYYTDFVGQMVYGGNPNAPETSAEGRAYDEGVRIASWGLLLHCICSAIFSFFIEHLTAAYGYKTTFIMGMTTFVAAMCGMVLVRHIVFVNLMAAITGMAYSTITTIPFMLVSKYHANKKVYFSDLPSSMLEDNERGIGADMAVLDWSYFLSQVALTVGMGAIVHITGTVLSYMVAACLMGILSTYFIRKVVEEESEALKLTRQYR